ncbi:uncharacterized protein LOC141609263 [Silene latifolia]|uniref:uncharacterized protein LOC141609263 n=1 Tax=Silene latifolia TaxID=37657 RepID=UPI003D7826A1
MEDPNQLQDNAPRTITLPLPAGLMNDEELQAKYPDVRKLKWMTSKRNLELVSRLHNDMTKELEAFFSVDVIADEVLQSEEVEDGKEPTQQHSQFSWTQALENNESFLAEFHRMGQLVDNAVAAALIEPPSFDLGLDDIYFQEGEVRDEAVENPPARGSC